MSKTFSFALNAGRRAASATGKTAITRTISSSPVRFASDGHHDHGHDHDDGHNGWLFGQNVRFPQPKHRAVASFVNRTVFHPFVHYYISYLAHIDCTRILSCPPFIHSKKKWELFFEFLMNWLLKYAVVYFWLNFSRLFTIKFFPKAARLLRCFFTALSFFGCSPQRSTRARAGSLSMALVL